MLVHGDNVMMGYWQRPDHTVLARDPERWLHTGDQARLQAGRLYLQGRLEDIIVTGRDEGRIALSGRTDIRDTFAIG